MTTPAQDAPSRAIFAVYPPPVLGNYMPLSAIFDPAHERYLEGAAVRHLYETDLDVKRCIDTRLRNERMKASEADLIRARCMPGKNTVYLIDPRDQAEALDTVNHLLAELDPRPETVTAVPPGTVPVRWDVTPAQAVSARLNLDAARADQIRHIRYLTRHVLEATGILHHIPQMVLLASDGAAIELFGNSRTGRTQETTPGA